MPQQTRSAGSRAQGAQAPQRPTAFLIDGTAFCYRAFYAIRSLSTSAGRPTNAVYGFARMLQSLRQRQRPDALAVAFDVGKPTFRHRQFEAYKGQRKPMPDPLIAQVPVVKRLLAAYRIPVFEQEGYEAEDVLATMARQMTAVGSEVWLVTGDKDALQLVTPQVRVYNPHKDDLIMDAAAVEARYGVRPAQMVDLMALMGDEIDNIPGVPGVGEKTARELLQRFGSLEALYQHLDEVDNTAQRERLAKAREQVELSRQLARIDSDVPITVSPDALKVQEPDWRALRTLFRELEFKQLLAELESQAPAVPPPAATIHPLNTPQAVARCLARVRSVDAALWCSPIGSSQTPGALVLAIAADDTTTWVGRLDQAWLASTDVAALREWLAGPSPKLGHDLKLSAKWLGRLGLELGGVRGDTMLAAYLLNPARTSQTLSDLSAEYTDQPLGPVPSPEDLAPAEADQGARWAPVGHAACAIVRLHRLLAPKLQEAGLAALYTELELPLVEVLARMERLGIALDVPYLAGLQQSMATELTRLTEEVYRLAGHAFNLNSPKQLAQVLFEELKLPVIKRTKTGASTDSSVLQQLAEQHPLPRTLIQYRELAKLVSTYIEALPRLVDPATGRLHTSFNQAATATGRLSSSEPNLQNIPVKTELGRSIRRAFIAGGPDGVLLAADYSQIELRILAHLSGDPQLAEAFRRGHDIHRFTASLIYGLPEAEVQPEQRQAMKAINYGILYGMSAHGLSKELGIAMEDAQAFIDAYFQRYPRIRRYLDDQIARARRDGFVQTLLGRRRYIPEVNSPDPMTRQFGERMAVNAPIQGTAADLIKRAMVQLDDMLRRHRLAGRMVLQVHDELVLELPRAELGAVAALVRQVMEGAIALEVPLEVTLKAGPNWLDLTKYEG